MNALARRAAGLLLGTLCLPLAAFAADVQPTHEFILDNGLKVVVREDHRAPVVVSQIWYKVGSSYETPGQTGLSHALEHNRLPVALELEADRLASLRLPADEFSKEIEVIKEERRLRTDDQPTAKAFELFRAMAYPASGYHTPTIGWMADLERMKVEELRHWYESWYAPNNATLVVVGDVTPDEVKGLAQKYFGSIPKRTVPPAKLPLELAEPGQRQLTLHVRTQLPSLIYGFNVPGLATTKDPRTVHALRLISALLDGGYSARMPARLERGQELVAGASSSYNAFTRGDSLFLISATPNVQKQKTLADVEKGVWQLLDELKTTPPSAEELERVRAQVIAGLVYDRDSISSQATTIGQLETVGLSWKLIDSELDELKRVTPQDIQNAARTYFTRERLSVAHVLPEESAHE
ncbi:pitrilysin family protein [Pseudomonas sp.]|uniref:M16 family metallopeptidase n=1 Tax=Pseudomonas sp. TaxID=306 RepID=UPI001D54BBFF|nr:pitrilysin family protein [Pseudomonas sp.]MBS6038493.1 insulinase family protein [Pseudomonas sp.]